eukprot:Hpha_TRINITY_DN12965_c0_g1::TRINITY_DN12965_c0_g1_i1::g.164381::m.164381/K12823/DDX5, DBP2; ATP-dependent RNA helicase DDX5/DBP2
MGRRDDSRSPRSRDRDRDREKKDKDRDRDRRRRRDEKDGSEPRSRDRSRHRRRRDRSGSKDQSRRRRRRDERDDSRSPKSRSRDRDRRRRDRDGSRDRRRRRDRSRSRSGGRRDRSDSRRRSRSGDQVPECPRPPPSTATPVSNGNADTGIQKRLMERPDLTGATFRTMDIGQVRSSDGRIRKDFYIEQETIKSLTDEDLGKILEKYNAKVTGKGQRRPVRCFEEVGLPDAIMSGIRAQGFTAPTAIQAMAWPQILSGFDVIGLAATGSGKTLGFGLPGIVHVKAQPSVRPGEGPIGIILAPTRELACQIDVEMKKYCEPCQVRVMTAYGGAPKREQGPILRRGVEFVVATPGRLNDFLEERTTNVMRCTYLVLDEADRMLDMGFEPQIRKILRDMRPAGERQTCLFSATWPDSVQRLARDFLHPEHIMINIGDAEKIRCNKDITQTIHLVSDREKAGRLMQVFQQVIPRGESVLIFTETKRKCDQIANSLSRGGVRALSIHGDKKQEEREQILNTFRTCPGTVLTATDVAARGLDIKGLNYVIQYDMVKNIEDYVHRIGRTGRAGAKGNAITFFDPDKNGFTAFKLVQMLEEADQEINPQLQALAQRYGAPAPRGERGRFRNRDDSSSRTPTPPPGYGGSPLYPGGASNGSSSPPPTWGGAGGATPLGGTPLGGSQGTPLGGTPLGAPPMGGGYGGYAAYGGAYGQLPGQGGQPAGYGQLPNAYGQQAGLPMGYGAMGGYGGYPGAATATATATAAPVASASSVPAPPQHGQIPSAPQAPSAPQPPRPSAPQPAPPQR